MGDHADWKNLPIELLITIAGKLKYLVDFVRFPAVCKTWKTAAYELENKKPCLPFEYHPWLLLAEDTGLDLSSVKITNLDAVPKDYYNLDAGHNFFGDAQTEEIDRIIDSSIVYLFKNINSSRGLFSLATQKVYNLDLPEATDKLILGTNKGWLLTLGRDLEINLLHPLLKEQIPLPPMLTYEYDDDFFPQRVFDMFITKAVMSSEVPTKSALQHHDTSHLPMIMIIYGEGSILGFARLGDKLWTNVETSTGCFYDIVYHKEKFYAIEQFGKIFVCDARQHKGTLITSVPLKINDHVQTYMVESLSGSHIWVAVRFRKGGLHEKGPLIAGDFWYYTSNFKIFKLDVHYSNSDDANPTCTWTQEVKDLGNEALFIGRGSSVSVASSKCIQPNSIYFTDDSEFCYDHGGHDMGIFNVKTGEIQPHFQGISIHPHSPSLWYF